MGVASVPESFATEFSRHFFIAATKKPAQISPKGTESEALS